MAPDPAARPSTRTRVATALGMALMCSACGGSAGAGGTPTAAGDAACTDQSGTRVLATIGASITVDASSVGPAAAPLIGFIHGIAAPSGADQDFPAETMARITALKPTLWKVSDSRHYLKAKSFGAQIMYASSDAYFNYQAIYYPWNNTGTASGTFDDWVNFDANATSVLQRSLTLAQPVDYWGVLNEPQFIQYTATDQQRMLATFKHGYHDFKDGHAEQKVVAPTTIGYSRSFMVPLLDDAVANGLTFDAIDWHELGTRPEDVVSHADDLRALLAARPGLGTPPIIIDEYASPAQHHLPGFAVAWFYYLEKAGVLRAARACWNMTDADSGMWSNCWDGLNGLFMKDNRTPQALYWVHERYAQMLGRKLDATSTAPRDVVALARSTASEPLAAGETQVLVGRFVHDNSQAGAAAKNISIQLQGLPASSTCLNIQVQRIPYLGPDVMSGANPTALPLAGPETVDSYTAKVLGGRVSAYLPAFRDRDAYYITFK
jgi:hypothetical protein